MENNWINSETMPDFDGYYLCFMLCRNECGTVGKLQRVMECKMNKWSIPTGLYWVVTHWMRLPKEPQLEYEPHEVSFVKCDLCSNGWVAVRPQGVEKLECPRCRNMVHFEIPNKQ